MIPVACCVGEIANGQVSLPCARVSEVFFLSDPRIDAGVWINEFPEDLFFCDYFTNDSKCEPHCAVIENV